MAVVSQMWLKTAMGFFGGLLVSLGFSLTAVKLLPGGMDFRMLMAILLVLPVWVGVMIYSYGCQLKRQAMARIGALLCVLIIINVLLYR